MTILDNIIENTKLEVAQRKSKFSLADLRDAAESFGGSRPSFYEALKQPGVNIIAEVKKASPSKGLICEDFNPVEIATDYERGGAAAISVLTDEKYFQGHLTFLDDIAHAVNTPLLRKDFIIDEYQIYEAKLHQASAILLLAVSLDVRQISEFLSIAHHLQLDVLLEVHSAEELENALKTPARIIGVNNRNLKTFEVSLQTSHDLARDIPDDKIKVAESGIFTHEDIAALQDSGFDAFLIGESLMRQDDRVSALKTLRGRE
jgi:indole-3-glycerol phosphate synthase